MSVLRKRSNHEHIIGHVQESSAGPGPHLSAAPTEAVPQDLMLVVRVAIKHQQVLPVSAFY